MAGRYGTEAENTARDYYNSPDADNFYSRIWGGEDLHLGIYETGEESIFDASRRTIERMADHASGLDDGVHVLDLGAGFGGTARYLVKRYGCRVTALNISEAENERNRRMNREQGVADRIEVVDGSFEELPFEDERFDVVWSQDAFLHSSDRAGVLREASRVLASDGEFVFTDPMMADDCPPDVLAPIFERLKLSSLGSPRFYQEAARAAGMDVVAFDDLSPHLARHYGAVLRETERREPAVRGEISQDYLDRMKAGLRHWVNGGERGHLVWGIFHFRKPSGAA